MVLDFIYLNINQGGEGEKIGIFWGVFNTDNDSRHFSKANCGDKTKSYSLLYTKHWKAP
jgi:hypothetical protein